VDSEAVKVSVCKPLKSNNSAISGSPFSGFNPNIGSSGGGLGSSPGFGGGPGAGFGVPPEPAPEQPKTNKGKKGRGGKKPTAPAPEPQYKGNFLLQNFPEVIAN
jgi:hypothetical protein